jgi:hypothetical protein
LRSTGFFFLTVACCTARQRPPAIESHDKPMISDGPASRFLKLQMIFVHEITC